MARDPLYTRLCEELGIEYPVVAFSHCKDVVVEVVNAGGLGVLGELAHTPDEIAEDIKWIRDRVGSKPFGIDLVFPASIPPVTVNREDLEMQIPQEHRDFIRRIKEEFNIPDPRPRSPQEMRGGGMAGYGFLSQENARKQAEVVLDERVPVLASGLGNPAFLVQAAHDRGMKVMGLIGNTRQAVREAEAGVDFVIAQGYDAGGHTGEIGTFSLVPQVADAIRPTPVLAAGGVGSGRHLVAALALGAAGVWTGTIWLTARESDTDIIVKQKILDATERDTVRTRAYTGKPARFLRTKYTEIWEQPGAPAPLPMPLQPILTRDLQAAIRDHRVADLMGSPAGQVVGLIKELKPARQIMFDIISEARDILDGWSVVPV